MNGFRLYLSFIRNCLRAQMLYPTAFLLRLVSQFVITITEFGGLYALFLRFSHIRGWTFPEIALFYGVVSVSFALADRRAAASTCSARNSSRQAISTACSCGRGRRRFS